MNTKLIQVPDDPNIKADDIKALQRHHGWYHIVRYLSDMIQREATHLINDKPNMEEVAARQGAIRALRAAIDLPDKILRDLRK